MDSAGTKSPKQTGTNYFTLLFSRYLVVQVHCLFYSSLSGPVST